MSAGAPGPADQGAAARALADLTRQHMESAKESGEAAERAHELVVKAESGS